jgi:hypothetical protein
VDCAGRILPIFSLLMVNDGEMGGCGILRTSLTALERFQRVVFLGSMATVTICLLANSAKNKARCIAGSLVEQTVDGGWRLRKKWIRPISYRPKGELTDAEVAVRKDGRAHIPRLMDIVEIPVDGPATIVGQPEDLFITKGASWHFKGRVNREAAIPKLVEQPENLWLEEGQKTDRATPDFVRANAGSSLYLIQPESFEARIETTTWDGKTSYHRTAYFRYHGTDYRLPFTDIVFGDTYCPKPWQMEEGPIPNAPTTVKALCISLSPPFSFSDDKPKLHYKFVAGIFE